MHAFTDAAGEQWRISLVTEDIKRVRRELDVDLLNCGDPQLLSRLANDPILIVDVLHVLLGAEAEKRQLDAYGFAARLAGDVLDSAAQALLGALCDFFPSRRRAVLQAAIEKTGALMDRQLQHAATLLADPRIEQLAELELQAATRSLDEKLSRLTAGGCSTSGPDSAELTPAF